MNINSTYRTEGEEVIYDKFICELDANTILTFEFKPQNEKKCKVTMEDKVSGIVDISSNINAEEVKSLIRTLRVVAVQLDKMEQEN